VALALAVGLVLSAFPVLAQSSSASYVLQQSTIDAAGEAGTSTSFALTASLGQELTVGTSSAPPYVLQSGFWSFLGSGLVPVILAVDKNSSNPGNVDWTSTPPRCNSGSLAAAATVASVRSTRTAA
jgi:hypothetical protein